MHASQGKNAVNVPEGFTAPSKRFKKQVIIALLALLLFVSVYLVLMVWFGYLSFNLFSYAQNAKDSSLPAILMGVFSGFLCLFMFKSLFIFKKREKYDEIVLTPEQEPALFEHLYQLADSVGAPRPNKVCISSEVNASVSYDLSIVNLFFPSKKNLLIGLGLVNVLTKSEFTAVLAHEFGHFAQRSMLFGRYVYVAHQIAVQIVGKRDFLDKILTVISSIDLRIAWIGWILQILVWSIRSLIEVIFSVVKMAELALSREMEFQADRVAVSVTGSDALVNSLYKFKVADEALSAAWGIVNTGMQKKKAVLDIFDLQTNHIEKMELIINDPHYFKPPKIDKTGKQRIFTDELVNPPQMWSTHPDHKDREENAKSTYIHVDTDDASAWDLFADPAAIRQQVTAELIKSFNTTSTVLSAEEGIELHNKEEFNWKFLDPAYNGVYINHYPFLQFETIADAYAGEVSSLNLKTAHKELYSEDFRKAVLREKDIKQEIELLENVRHEAVTAEKRKIMHRGKKIAKRDIPVIIVTLKNELKECQKQIKAFDKTCRATYLSIANGISSSVADHLQKSAEVVHYCEHSIANLEDAYKKYNNTFYVVAADGKISQEETILLLNDANEVHRILSGIFSKSKSFVLPQKITERLEADSYGDLFERFALEMPTEEILPDWTGVIDGWVASAMLNVYKLRSAALEYFLWLEEELAQYHTTGKPVSFEDAEITIADNYPVLVPGNEREIKRKLSFWDRFHMNDGIVPMLTKFAAACVLVLGTIIGGSMIFESSLYIYNGLQTTVKVEYRNNQISISPNTFVKKSYPVTGDDYITATTLDGDTIEHFLPQKSFGHADYIYNIANGAALIKHQVVYSGYGMPDGEDEIIGNDRWNAVNADFILSDPPNQITTSSSRSSISKDYIAAYSDYQPQGLVAALGEKSHLDMIMNHCIWDEPTSKYCIYWLYYAAAYDPTLSFVKKRQAVYEEDVLSYRILKDFSDSVQEQKYCQQFTEMSKQNPNNGDYAYLATRCISDKNERKKAFLKHYAQWPDNPWLANASAFYLAANGEWDKAHDAFTVAFEKNKGLSTMRGLDFERVRRYIGLQKDVQRESYLLTENEEVKYVKSLETGTDASFDQFDMAYSLIAKGKIEEALGFVKEDNIAAPFINRIVAASDVNNKTAIEAVSSYTLEEGINASTIWMALGLAVKNKESISNIKNKLDELMETGYPLDYDKDITARFIAALQVRDIKRIEKAISQVDDFKLQAFYRMSACVAIEKRPNEWVEKVNALLFANEKPYLMVK